MIHCHFLVRADSMASNRRPPPVKPTNAMLVTRDYLQQAVAHLHPSEFIFGYFLSHLSI